MNYKILILLMLCLLPMASAAQTWNLHFSDGLTTINATNVCLADGTCLTDSSSGDISAVNTAGPYLSGGAASGAISLLFNSSALNITIDALSVGNLSFNETYTDGIYAALGAGNISWNQTYAGTLYADIAVITDNSTFNQILTDTMYGNINLTTDNSTFNQILTDTMYGNINLTTDNSTFNQILTDTMYANLNTTGDNSSFNQILTDTMYGNINLTTDNSSWSETYAKTIFNQSWNQTWSDIIYIAKTNEGNLNTNSSTWWAGISGWVAGWFQQTGDNIEFNESRLNATISAKLEVQFFNATSVHNVTGVESGVLADIQTYDRIFYNITETNSDFELLVNFTGITEFSSLIVRHKTNVQSDHFTSIEIWDYNDGEWEGLGFLSEGITSEIQTIGVYDSEEHINNTVVQIRFYQDEGPPNTAHIHSFDWVILSKGFGTPIGVEVDPLSFKRNQTINNSGFNISADYIFGNGTFLLGVNESWVQVLGDTLYADIAVVTDNSSWSETYAKTIFNQSFNETWTDLLYADISVVTDNSSWSETYAKTIFNLSWNQTWADTQYRIATWDNFTGIPTATPSNGDTTHLSTADHIYDWAVGLFLQAMDYTNVALTNVSETFESNVTVERLVFEVDVTHTIYDNATCVILGGSTSRFEIC